MTFRAYCPVGGKCDEIPFIAPTKTAAIELVREHLKKNLEDPIHSDIAELEGWFDPDPLGD